MINTHFRRQIFSSTSFRLTALATVVLATTATVWPEGKAAKAPPVSIGAAEPFAVFGGTAVTNTDPTLVMGDLGVSPGDVVEGFPPGRVTGTIHAGDATAATAKADIVAAYDDLAGRAPTATIAPQLGGVTLTPGVYASTTGDFRLNGRLVLDAQTDPDALFIFQAGDLTTDRVSSIDLVGGAQTKNVYWQISGSGALGPQSTFYGTAIARNAIAVAAQAVAQGHLFALNNTVGTVGSLPTPSMTIVRLPNEPPTTTTLTSSPNPATSAQPITFTARVAAVSGSVKPTGTVVFKEGSTVLGTAYHDIDTPARLTIKLPPGEHRVVAVFIGGLTFNHEEPIDFAPSTSAPLTQTVTA
ncbi:ice-binding family protein [Nonomuraea pusilla]|nr:ice-binding family protein [Nonomuraea pusilla]